MKILYAEDNEALRRVVLNELIARGETVVTVTNGQELLDRLEDEVFDVVITDHSMPIMTGLEVCRRIRQDARLKQLPVIVFSSSAIIRQTVEKLDCVFVDKSSRSPMADIFAALDALEKKKG